MSGRRTYAGRRVAIGYYQATDPAQYAVPRSRRWPVRPVTPPLPWMTAMQRAVWTHEAFRGRIVLGGDPDACWRYAAGASHRYERVGWAGRIWYAHRLAYIVATGRVPAVVPRFACALGCVNPEHMAESTLAELLDMPGRRPARRAFPAINADVAAAIRALYPYTRPPLLAEVLGVSLRTVYRYRPAAVDNVRGSA